MQPVPQVLPKQLAQRLNAPDGPIVVDVRNPQETLAEGTIDGALLIPLNELAARAAEIPSGRDVVCVCKMGMRSLNAAAFLRQRGLPATNLAGGMAAWASAGLPVRR